MAFSATVCWSPDMTITIQPVPYQTILNQNAFEKTSRRLLAGHQHDDHQAKKRKPDIATKKQLKTIQYFEGLGCPAPPPPPELRFFLVVLSYCFLFFVSEASVKTSGKPCFWFHEASLTSVSPRHPMKLLEQCLLSTMINAIITLFR